MLKVSISLQKKKNIEKAAALGVILIAKEKNFIQVNVRCFLVEESHVILDKYITRGGILQRTSNKELCTGRRKKEEKTIGLALRRLLDCGAVCLCRGL